MVNMPVKWASTNPHASVDRNSIAIKDLARECGFELAGVTSAVPIADSPHFRNWISAGFAGEMGYLTDRRADVRADPRHLLPTARSIISVGKLYNTPLPYSTRFNEPQR